MGRKRMSDLRQYMEKRKAEDLEFADGFDSGHEELKIGLLIKELRL
jgi:hypothetical protein